MPKLIVNDVTDPQAAPLASADAFGAGIGRAVSQVGQATASLARPLEAMSAMKARRSAAEYSSALEAEANRLSLSPDIEKAPEEFEKVKTRLESQYRKGLGSTRIFDDQAGQSTRAIRNRFTHSTNVRAIQNGRNDLEQTLTLHADEMARAEDPQERALSMIKGELALEDARQSGIIDDITMDKMARDHSKKAMGGILRRLQTDDPAGGFAFLESGEFDGTEEERQVWRGTMLKSMRAQASAALTQDRREEIRIARESKERGVMGRKYLYEQATVGDGITTDDVLGMQADLTPESFERLMGIAMGGGRPAATQTNPEIFRQLTLSAEEGGVALEGDAAEQFENAVFRHWSSGAITQQDVIRLRQKAYDVAVKEPLSRIKEAIGGGFLGDPFKKAKAVQAEQKFLDWYASQSEDGIPPDALQIKEFSDLLIVSGSMVDTSEIQAANVRPLFLVKDKNGNDDYVAAAERTRNAANSGLITPDVYAKEVEILEAWAVAEQERGNNQ